MAHNMEQKYVRKIMELWPGITEEEISTAFTKYQQGVISALAPLWQYDEIGIGERVIYNACGQITIKASGKRTRCFSIIHPVYPIYELTTRKGFTGKNPKVAPIMERIDLDIFNTLTNPEEILKWAYRDPVAKAESDGFDTGTVIVPVDIESIDAYIHNTKHSVSKNQPWLGKYLRYAQALQRLAGATNNGEIMSMTRQHWGRTYHMGLSLQAAPRVVRQAALGSCHQIDIKSCAHTIKLLLGMKFGIVEHGTHTYIKEYISQSHEIRNSLLRAMGVVPAKDPKKRTDREKQYTKNIKQVITAFGFGAHMSGSWENPATGEFNHASFTTIVKDEELRKKMEAARDGWLVKYREEQVQLNKQLAKVMKDSGLTKWLFDQTGVTLDDLATESGNFSPTRFIAFICQAVESLIADEMIEELEKYEVLLHVHDAVYTRNRPGTGALEIVLKNWTKALSTPTEGQAPNIPSCYYLRVDVDEYDKWVPRDPDKKKLDEEAYTRHLDSIYEEQELAQENMSKVREAWTVMEG